ncbi:MAG: PD-(D/E)XK nuclease family protein [Pseudomonadota bacterium]
MGIDRIPLAGAILPETVARQLLDRHADLLPDLSGLVVLVPNHRAGQDFARALAHAAGHAALIPPFITPLKSWAENLAEGAAEPQSQRLARLYGVLRREGWLGTVDRWALAEELLQLADELSAARLCGEIAGRLRPLRGEHLGRETALIEAVWQALNTGGSDPQARYARALDALLEQAAAVPRPLYGYALGPLTALEKKFLERHAEHAPVRLFEASTQAADGVTQVLDSAWRVSPSPIKTRAMEVASVHTISPLHGRLRLCPAPHLEAEARAVATWVAGQLNAGRRRIGLIALDRESSRRVRALLERMNVLVADETGWALSTTAAAAVIDRWLECVARDFPHVEFLDLLKSPFVLGEVAARQDSVLALELAMRRQGVAQGMNELRRLAGQHVPGALPWLDALAAAARGFPRSRASLGAWLGRLEQSLARLQATGALKADAAGASLMETLARLRAELALDTEKYGFGEWRRWLDRALENAAFVDESVASPIVLTSLPAARGRSFEAVAVIGADAARLPGTPGTSLFNQATRAQLGLPTFAEAARQSVEDLIPLLACGQALLSWQAWHEDEPNPASPLVIRLQALHEAAWGSRLETQAADEAPARASEPPPAAGRPAPAVPPERLPDHYSPTAYQTLLDCPYRFFAKSVLRLEELEEADEALDKSDYGTALHAILKRFHDAAPPEEREAALALLREYSEAGFAGLPAYTAAAWRARWQGIHPAYVDAWLDQVAEGWRYQSGETELERRHQVPGLGEVRLHGRIDRIDRNKNALRVIDYKTRSLRALKNAAADPEENVQLPFYAWLAGAEAAFLPIDDETVAPVCLDGETDVEAISLRLPQLLEAIAAGAKLPANGVDAVCRYCEARGLCRKGNWDE